MEKEFVPYGLALKLKEIGFDEPCMAFYFKRGAINKYWNRIYTNSVCEIEKTHNFHCTAPLWQQAWRWLADKGWISIYSPDNDLDLQKICLNDMLNSFKKWNDQHIDSAL